MKVAAELCPYGDLKREKQANSYLSEQWEEAPSNESSQYEVLLHLPKAH